MRNSSFLVQQMLWLMGSVESLYYDKVQSSFKSIITPFLISLAKMFTNQLHPVLSQYSDVKAQYVNQAHCESSIDYIHRQVPGQQKQTARIALHWLFAIIPVIFSTHSAV